VTQDISHALASRKLLQEKNDMNIRGLPEKFWVVTRPSRVSELGDICFQCTFKRLMLQTRGGLHEHEIIGIFSDEAEAKRVARKLLGRNVVRTSDSIMVEVLVNVLMMPMKKNLTARVLARAAAEAVGNAVHKAEQEGFRHRLRGQVTMGAGAVELQSHTTLFG
jgi:hypothetical protein